MGTRQGDHPQDAADVPRRALARRRGAGQAGGQDACLQAPGLDLDGRPSSGGRAQVAYETRKLLDARMPGWSRVQTDWETALIHHESLRVVRLGAGMLDIDGDTAS